MEEEVWKQIPSLPGYEASSLGRIKRLSGQTKWNGNGYQKLKEKVFNGTLAVNGYIVVRLRSKTRYVHRMIAEAWHGEIGLLKLDVNHIDGNKRNNSPANLEWCDRKRNINHAYDLGLMKIKSEHHNSKYSQEFVDNIIKKFKETGLLPTELKRRFFPDIPRTTISSFIHNHRRKGRTLPTT